MRRRLHYPVWMNFGAGAVYVWLLTCLLQAWPLPARVPVHFGASGLPNRWGSRWELVAAVLITPLALLVMRAVMAELSARHERTKRFTWIVLLFDLGLAFSASAVMENLAVAPLGSAARFVLPLPTVLLLAIGLTIVDVLCESIRPWQPQAEEVVAGEASAVQAELQTRIASGQRWAYWEAQNPVYVTLLVIGVTGSMVFAAISTRPVMPWMLPVWIATVAIMVAMLGGLHVSVTPDRVEVRLGYVGLRLLRVRLADLVKAEVTSFSPLGDFGGWGIRYNGKQWGFFFRGTRGVKLRAVSGKEWIVGSDDPARLAAVIAAARDAHEPGVG